MLNIFISDMGIKVLTVFGLTFTILGAFYMVDILFKHQQMVLKWALSILTSMVVAMLLSIMAYYLFVHWNICDASPVSASTIIIGGGIIGVFIGVFSSDLNSLEFAKNFRSYLILFLIVLTILLVLITISDVCLLRWLKANQKIYKQYESQYPLGMVLLSIIAALLALTLHILITFVPFPHLSKRIVRLIVSVIISVNIAVSPNILLSNIVVNNIPLYHFNELSSKISMAMLGGLCGLICGGIMIIVSSHIFRTKDVISNEGEKHIETIDKTEIFITVGVILTLIGYMLQMIDPISAIFAIIGQR